MGVEVGAYDPVPGGRDRQGQDPWGSLASQPRLLGELQNNETL